MSDYSDLNDIFDHELRATARFRRAAFHVHSPDSHDWGKGGTGAPTIEELRGPAGQTRFLDELVTAGLELVCITDHMKAGYACELAKLAATREDITVFPGMEISCRVAPAHSERIHVLAVFPPETTPDVMERIFVDQPELPGAAERTGHEEVTFASLKEVRDRVDAPGGLFVLAHIDEDPRGHRCYVRSVRGETASMFAIDPHGAETVRAISREYADHLVELDPHAVEVRKSSDRAHYWDFSTHDGTRHGYPCVARADHHSVQAFGAVDAVTFLKVSRSDIGCVRDALRFHETRLRFAEDLPLAPSPRLVGIRLRGGGLFSEATIALNENLNCIIGPRGCGKSTVIEALRYVLGQRALLPDASPRGEDDRSYASLAVATQKANLKDTEIELIYEREGERHLLAATYDPDQTVATRSFSLDGEDLRIAADAIEAAYPARIFSWSELETLGRQPRLQRLVVDRLAEGLPALLDRQESLRAELRANRLRASDLRQRLESVISQQNGTLRRYVEYETAYAQLNTPEVQALFAALDRVRGRLELLATVDGHLREIDEDAARLESRDPAAHLETILGEHDGELREWWEAGPTGDIDLAGLTAITDKKGSEVRDAIRARREAIAAQLASERADAEAHETAIREQTHASPGESVKRDQREQARERLEAASTLRDEYLRTFAELEEALEHRGKLLGVLAAVTAEITDAREQTAGELGKRLAEIQQAAQSITVAVHPGADRATYQAHADEKFLNPERGGQYKAQGVPERLASIEPTEVAYAILAKAETSLMLDGALTAAEARRLVGAFDVFSEDTDANVTRVTAQLEELLELQEQPIDDLVRIESDGRPVDELSPGGRSSAMLPLIALSDTVPLIIDQPEDNLDNRMVGQTLSSILSRLKEQRQIIVTTHNPNIVVGGDAEQVVVLDAPDARSARVETAGSIDDPEIIDAVIKIMEGGREAFRERTRRYRDRLA
ncbi:MAG TPA: AAA family ATPase [Solirubrobacteraceae bacterium]|nr:AAA family ATPase [Solirubrobacteraceae bacterium]